METISGIITWAIENKTALTIVAGFIVRLIEKRKIKRQWKRELHDAYGKALEAAVVQLKNEKNGYDKKK